MKRKTMKKLKGLLFLMLCITTILGASTVQAKTMGTTKGITWDLMPGKSLTYYTYVGGAGYIKQKVKLTNPTTKLLSDKKTAQLTFTLKYTRQVKPTAKQIHAILDYYSEHPEQKFSPSVYYAVVDYKTGKSLEAPNSYGVTVKNSGWKYGSYKKYSAGEDAIYLNNCSVKVTIRYPISYTRMCIGAGGLTRLTYKSADKNFWNGTNPFWKGTRYFTTKKKVAHFIGYGY